MTLPIGRELDALVAERVMGGKWVRFYDADYADPDSGDGKVHASIMVGEDLADFLDDDKYVEDTGECPRDRFSWIPHYSTDIAVAWEVVEKMAERKLFFTINDMRHGCYRNHRDGPPFVGFRVEVSPIDEEEEHGPIPIYNEDLFAEADTAPHAICLAALRAVEGAKI